MKTNGAMKYTQRIMSGVLLTLLVVGCAETGFGPSSPGVSDSAQATRGLLISIKPTQSIVAKGDLVEFDVIIRNTSDHPIWIPAHPHVVFVWTYPNGRKDNFMEDEPVPQFFEKNNSVCLNPGKGVRIHKNIKTYYFPFTGITEFHAIYCATPNKNPAFTGFWQGEAYSNGYGVDIRHKGYMADPNCLLASPGDLLSSSGS